MSPEAQNRAICKALGKRYHKPTPEEIARGSYYHYQYEPDYLNDLNAMHEAEKVLGPVHHHEYWKYLEHCNPNPYCVCFATAAQRAEAFLKTLGLWKD